MRLDGWAFSLGDPVGAKVLLCTVPSSGHIKGEVAKLDRDSQVVKLQCAFREASLLVQQHANDLQTYLFHLPLLALLGVVLYLIACAAVSILLHRVAAVSATILVDFQPLWQFLWTIVTSMRLNLV